LEPDRGNHVSYFLITDRQEQDDDQERVKEQQQEHKALFAVYAQFFFQVWKPGPQLGDKRPDHTLCRPCALCTITSAGESILDVGQLF
jgi:hypothetical protein